MKRLTLLLLVIAAVGCDSGPKIRLKDAGVAQLPAGWKQLDSVDGNLSIGVPNDWRMWTRESEQQAALGSLGGMLGIGDGAPVSPGDFAAGKGETAEGIAEQIERDLEDSAREEMREWAKEGILLKAKDSARPIPGEDPTSVIIKTEKVRGNPTLEQALEQAASKMMVGDIRKEIVDLPIGQAAKVASSYESRGGDRITEVVYVLYDNGTEYRARFITVNTGVPIEKRAEEMMQTLRIKPQP